MRSRCDRPFHRVSNLLLVLFLLILCFLTTWGLFLYLHNHYPIGDRGQVLFLTHRSLLLCISGLMCWYKVRCRSLRSWSSQNQPVGCCGPLILMQLVLIHKVGWGLVIFHLLKFCRSFFGQKVCEVFSRASPSLPCPPKTDGGREGLGGKAPIGGCRGWSHMQLDRKVMMFMRIYS